MARGVDRGNLLSLRGDTVCSIDSVVGMLAAVRVIGRVEQGGLINHGPSVLDDTADLEAGDLVF